MYTNIASLMAKFNDFVTTVKLHRPSFILIAETFLNNNIPDSLVNLPNYTLYRRDRLDRVGGGVCIYVMNDIAASYNVSIDPFTIASQEIIIMDVSDALTLVCLYRPPSRTLLPDDIQVFDKLIELSNSRKNLIIVGDFNLPTIDWNSDIPLELDNSAASHLQNRILDSRLIQLVKEYTRFRINQAPSMLDLIFTNDEQLVSETEYLPPIGISDHISLISKIQLICKNIPKSTFKEFKIINYANVNRDLANIEWLTTILSAADVDDMWIDFCHYLNSVVEGHTTVRRVRYSPSKPWINNNILNMIRHKKCLWKRYKRTQSLNDYEMHRNYSNQVSQIIADARKNYEENISQDSKKIFKYIRTTNNTKVATPLLRKDDNNTCKNNMEVAEVFSEFFSEVFTTDAAVHHPNNQFPESAAILENITFTEEKVLQCIQKLKLSSSPGPDGITTALLKHCSSALAAPLSVIMQTSFNAKKVPVAWKLASVTPIYKKGDKLKAENYRPISLTSVPCKLMESIISDEMMSFFLNETDVIPNEQHGFIRGRSVMTNLLYCVNNWSRSVDNKQPVDVIYLDFAKAFDRVSHAKLIDKLKHAGIRGGLLLWIKDYLSDREFCVRVGNELSRTRKVTSGVPQGSVLGPVLFNVYVSDIPRLLLSKCALYADDCKLFGNPITHYATLQRDLQRIHHWCTEWSLPLNITKCVVLHIGKTNPRLPYNIDGTLLNTTESHNDLGVTITNNLSWSEHIALITRKSKTSLFLLKKTFQAMSFNTSVQLYKSLVRPILEHCGPVWSVDLVRDNEMLERVQRYATRLSYGRRRPPYEQRLEQGKLSLFEKRRLRGDLIITYRVLHGLFGVDLSELFILNRDPRLRGHNYKLQKDFKTRARQNFLCNRVFDIWNSLPYDVVNSNNVNTFKNKLDLYCNQ